MGRAVSILACARVDESAYSDATPIAETRAAEMSRTISFARCSWGDTRGRGGWGFHGGGALQATHGGWLGRWGWVMKWRGDCIENQLHMSGKAQEMTDRDGRRP